MSRRRLLGLLFLGSTVGRTASFAWGGSPEASPPSLAPPLVRWSDSVGVSHVDYAAPSLADAAPAVSASGGSPIVLSFTYQYKPNRRAEVDTILNRVIAFNRAKGMQLGNVLLNYRFSHIDGGYESVEVRAPSFSQKCPCPALPQRAGQYEPLCTVRSVAASSAGLSKCCCGGALLRSFRRCALPRRAEGGASRSSHCPWAIAHHSRQGGVGGGGGGG